MLRALSPTGALELMPPPGVDGGSAGVWAADRGCCAMTELVETEAGSGFDLGVAAVHDRLFWRGEAALAHDDDDRAVWFEPAQIGY